MNLKKPLFWDFPKLNFLAYILLPLTFPLALRNFFFKFKKKKKFSNIKTICVGNIYLGGTGKTPLTIKIYNLLKKNNLAVATVKKYYQNQRDEQILLQQQTSLILKKSRIEAINEGIKNNLKYLIFDDGFQDSTVEYDLNFLCFKTSTWIGNGKLIPAGPLRENISSLNRADAVFLNGDSKNYESIEKQIKEINSNIKIFKTSYEISNNNELNLKDKYLIFSGIGNPSDFKNLLIANKIIIEKEFIFSDHHAYNEKDLKKIIAVAKKNNLGIITTEKDYIKIPDIYKSQIKIVKINLTIQNQNELINMLDF